MSTAQKIPPTPKKKITLEDLTEKATEQAVLSFAANTPEFFCFIADDLSISDFYYPNHQELLKGLQGVAKAEKTPNAVNCIEEMKRQAGSSWKVETAGEVLNLFNIPFAGLDYYESISSLKAKAAMREALKCVDGVMEMIEAKTTVEELRENLDRELGRIEKHSSMGKGIKSMRQVAEELEKKLKKDRESKFSLPGISTGMYDLDQLTKGLQKGHLVILAARPGCGKTTLALNLASHISARKNPLLPVGFISLEMSDHELGVRWASSLSGLKLSLLQQADWDVEQGEILFASLDKMKEVGAYFNDSSGSSLSAVTSKAAYMKRCHGIEALFIDYLQLMRLSDSPSGAFSNRVYEVSEITRSLKLLAKKLEIPIICLSQLSREVEKREAGRPKLSDLRDSGSIEQDADIVIFIKAHEEDEGRGNEIIVAKNRHGECGIVKAEFNKELCRFEEI